MTRQDLIALCETYYQMRTAWPNHYERWVKDDCTDDHQLPEIFQEQVSAILEDRGRVVYGANGKKYVYGS